MAVDHDRVLEILGRYDFYDAKSKLKELLGDEETVGKTLWALDGAGRFDFATSASWLDPLEEAPAGSFSGEQLAGLVERISQQPDVVRWLSTNKALQGWNADLTSLVKKVPDEQKAPLLALQLDVPDPMRQSMGYALAQRGWLTAAELDDDVLPEVARYIADGTKWSADLEAAAAVWPPEQLGPAYAVAGALPETEIWNVEFLEVAAPYSSPEQRAKILLNCDYDNTVPKLLAWGEQHAEGVADALLEHFESHEAKARYGKVVATIFLARQGMATRDHVAAAFENLDRDFMPLLAEALKGMEGIAELVASELGRKRLLWLLLPAFPNEVALGTAVKFISKWGRSAPWEKKLAIEGLRGLPAEAAEYLITVPIAKYPHRDVVAIGLAATGNPIAIPRLVELFGDGSAAVREAAVEGLVKIGEPSLDAVEKALSSRKKNARLCAAEVLAGLPLSERVIAVAAARLDKEKTDDVRSVLGPVAAATPGGAPDLDAEMEAIRAAMTPDQRGLFETTGWAVRNAGDDDVEPVDLAPLRAEHGAALLVGLADMLVDDWYSDRSTRAWLRILEEHGDEHRAIADALTLRMVDGVRDRRRDGETHAERVMAAYRGPVEPVRAQWEDTDRRWPAILAEWLAAHDPDAGPWFAARLSHRDRKLQRRAAAALCFVDGARGLMHDALAAKKAAAREAAASWLLDNPHGDSSEQVQAALAKEKSAKVGRILRDARYACESVTLPPITGLARSAQAHAALDARLATAGYCPPEDDLPQLTWEPGEALTDGAMAWVVDRLQKEGPDTHDQELVSVVSRTTGGDALLAALRERYGHGKEARIGWVLFATALFADDVEMTDLGRKLDEMARGGQWSEAAYTLEVLLRHGSTPALQWVDHWSRRARSRGLKERSQAGLDEIAAARGLTRAEIAEEVMADYGFDPRGERVWEHGDRRFTVKLGVANEIVLLADGRRVKGLPGARKTDDAAAIKASKKAFSAFKKQVKQGSVAAVERLEQAMIAGRRWEPERWTRVYLGNAALANLAMHVLWGDFGESAVTPFRVAEDRTLADLDEEPLTPTGQVGVLHPMMLEESALVAWTTLFTEYEITGPFEQFDRPRHAPTDEERSLASLTRWDATEIDALKLLGALGRGQWYRGEALDGGGIGWWLKPFGVADVTAVLETDPGYYAGAMTDSEPQRITGVRFFAGVHTSHPHSKAAALPLDQVDAIVFSEVVQEIAPLFED